LPIESVTAPITTEELSQHVDFLTQPALKGRSAGSWESRHVRDYLSQRLEQYGCVPWADTESFEQDFGFGKNIIGIFPGSDPELSKEIVLISAHYDHLKAGWFSYYPGACDNAAAVAVLLEIAEKLSHAEKKPKRTICFAFFDAEEKFCLGSFAFTCRNDYDDSNVIGVINMDLLGRDMLDVVDQCLLVTGTEHYVHIQNAIATDCEQSNLKFVPMETALVGPVGDHVAFTSNLRPVLFFTCGINKDYHQLTDTPDKLNYNKLKGESTVIENTLLSLANAESTLLVRSPAYVTRQRADSLPYILHKIRDEQVIFKLDPNSVNRLDTMVDKTEKIDIKTTTRDELIQLEREAVGELIEILSDFDETLSSYGRSFLGMSKFYALSPEMITTAYRHIVEHYLENKPSVFNNNGYTYKKYLPITKEDWGIMKNNNGNYVFGLLENHLFCEIDGNIFKAGNYSFGFRSKVYAFKGSLDDISDHLSFEVSRREFMKERQVETKNLEIDSKVKFPKALGERMRKSVQSVRDDDTYRIEEWNEVIRDYSSMFLQEVLEPDPNLFASPNHSPYYRERWSIPRSYYHYETWPPNYEKEICFSASSPSPESMENQCVQLILDPNTQPEIRTMAIYTLERSKRAFSLMALVSIIDDIALYDTIPWWLYDEYFPLKNHPLLKGYILGIKAYYEKEENSEAKTFGQLAYEALKRATNQDFEKDKNAWGKWIDEHYKSE
jgi:hypothetical protein